MAPRRAGNRRYLWWVTVITGTDFLQMHTQKVFGYSLIRSSSGGSRKIVHRKHEDIDQ